MLYNYGAIWIAAVVKLKSVTKFLNQPQTNDYMSEFKIVMETLFL